jgi:AbrB family looped-hinge helix DNA binding protein
LTLSLIDCDDRLVAKVTGKFQITLPKALAERCGIRVGDDLDLRPVGRSIQIDRRTPHDASQMRGDRLAHFDRATTRQRTRERTTRLVRTRSRGWTREERYVRGRTR